MNTTSATTSCCLFLIIFYVLVYLSQGATVLYVPNAACATPSGCDFNSAIWNTTGGPVAGDDVYINSDVEITIFANYTNVSLNLLWIGDDTGAAITFIVNNSVLQMTKVYEVDDPNAIALLSENAILVFLNSSLLCLHSNVDLATVIGYNATFNSSGLGADEFNVTSSTIYAECDFTNATFDSSLVYGDQISFNNLYSNGSLFDFASIDIYNSTQINNGQVTANRIYLGSSAVFIDTNVNIERLFFGDESSVVELLAPNLPSSSTFDIITNHGCPLNTTVYLDGRVTVTITNGIVCNFQLGDEVTLNLHSGYFSITIANITTIGTIPATLNVISTVAFINEMNLLANVYVQQSGILIIQKDLELSAISGDGVLAFAGGNLTCSDFSMAHVHYSPKMSITVRSQFNTSLITTDGSSTTFFVNAPETNIWSMLGTLPNASGISLGNNNMYFNGSYQQTRGVISLYGRGANNAAAIVVNGSISLTQVTVTGLLSSDLLSLQRFVIFRSLVNSILKADVVVENTGYRVGTENGDIYVEQLPTPTPKPHPEQKNLEEYYMWFAIGGGGALLIIGVLVAIVMYRRRSKKQYERIN